MMELFINGFLAKVPSQMFSRIPNTSLKTIIYFVEKIETKLDINPLSRISLQAFPDHAI